MNHVAGRDVGIGLAAARRMADRAREPWSRARSPRRQARLNAGSTSLTIKAGHAEARSLGGLKAGRTYALLVTLESGRLQPDDRLTVELSGAGYRQVRQGAARGRSRLLSSLSARTRRPGPS